MRSAPPASCHPTLFQEDRTIPRTSHDNNLPTVPIEREPQSSTDALLVDSDEMLAHMWQTSRAISIRTQVTVRCRAIAKCVWREWRNLLRLHDGQWILPGDLLAALSHSFEQTVVDYGWVSHWRELPPAFTQIMKKTAQAVTDFS
ncbi:Hypothetical predicted protein [Lecanosticta acicola]|uniref:Uncharacterized protein n=1 Tax=Lecanosticta acicola TaxID=111012 RepID=A0AAI8Z6P6_9PEZI|nr:Hypothetical predicted protein [Lecanosticta acicola]